MPCATLALWCDVTSEINNVLFVPSQTFLSKSMYCFHNRKGKCSCTNHL